ncbi:pectinesterase QRT1 [Ziziphus jujuba]|uniref:pectinesterase n=1 Tax=Ziziphus jujuba TaxID=326968 RepID=A0ABM3IA76_ZIZJJ|nr:pectinesterase QRT1 [Ziziphus jujuba]
MADYYSSAFVFALVGLLGSFQACFSQNTPVSAKNYISWDDFKINFKDLGSNSGNAYDFSHVIVVDKNGGGNFSTVQGAIDMVPEHNTQRVKIYILPGTYRKPNEEFSSFHFLLFYFVSENANVDKNQYGIALGTYNSASVTVESDYFCATRITFENSAVPVRRGQGNQAVALRIAGDKAMFYKARFLGKQDTLLDESGTHFFYKCFIQGRVDFVFGRARSLYKECHLNSIAKRSGAIAAHHRDSPDETGFSFVNCVITGRGRIYLGRAWGTYSRIIYSYCNISDIIIPKGWSDWDEPSRHKTVEFGEYHCQGKGADQRRRVSWSKNFTSGEIRPFLGTKYINEEQWLRM